MFSYRPLIIMITVDRKLKISNVCKECGMSHNVGRNIMDNKSIEIKNLVKICEYLGITLDQAIDINL